MYECSTSLSVTNDSIWMYFIYTDIYVWVYVYMYYICDVYFIYVYICVCIYIYICTCAYEYIHMYFTLICSTPCPPCQLNFFQRVIVMSYIIVSKQMCMLRSFLTHMSPLTFVWNVFCISINIKKMPFLLYIGLLSANQFFMHLNRNIRMMVITLVFHEWSIKTLPFTGWYCSA